MRWLDDIIDSMDVGLSELRELVMDVQYVYKIYLYKYLCVSVCPISSWKDFEKEERPLLRAENITTLKDNQTNQQTNKNLGII